MDSTPLSLSSRPGFTVIKNVDVILELFFNSLISVWSVTDKQIEQGRSFLTKKTLFY